MKKIIALVLVILPSLLTAQDFEKVDAKGTDSKNGVYYSLPKAVLTLEIPVTKITWSKGKYFDTEPEITELRKDGVTSLTKAGKKEITFYEIGDISMSSYPVPDMNKLYFAKVNRNLFKNRKLTFVMNDLAVLQSAEQTNEDKTFDIITQIVSSVASVAGVAMKVPKSPGTPVAATPQDILKDKLKEIREARFELLSVGRLTVSEAIYNRQLAELDKMENAIIAEFTYSEEKKASTYRIDVLLDDRHKQKFHNLFKFDSAKSVMFFPVDTSDYTNTYLNKGIKFLATAEQTIDKDTYQLWTITQKVQIHEKISSSEAKNGIGYNVPAKCQLKVVNDKTVVSAANMMIPQYGAVAYLNKKMSSSIIELDPNTGALRKVVEERKGLSADQIKAAGGSAESVIGLSNKQTETAKLEEEAKKLELRDKILRLNLSIDSLVNKK